MYAPGVQLKGERAARKGRARKRGRKSRGSRDSRAQRKRLALASVAPLPMDEMIHAEVQRSMRRLDRISYLDRRFDSYLSTLILKFNELDMRAKKVKAEVEDYLSRIRSPDPMVRWLAHQSIWPKGRLRRRRVAAVKLALKLHPLQVRMTQIAMGHWGLPRDATIHRLRACGNPGFGSNALPRIGHVHRQIVSVNRELLVSDCMGCSHQVLVTTHVGGIHVGINNRRLVARACESCHQPVVSPERKRTVRDTNRPESKRRRFCRLCGDEIFGSHQCRKSRKR